MERYKEELAAIPEDLRAALRDEHEAVLADEAEHAPNSEASRGSQAAPSVLDGLTTSAPGALAGSNLNLQAVDAYLSTAFPGDPASAEREPEAEALGSEELGSEELGSEELGSEELGSIEEEGYEDPVEYQAAQSFMDFGSEEVEPDEVATYHASGAGDFQDAKTFMDFGSESAEASAERAPSLRLTPATTTAPKSRLSSPQKEPIFKRRRPSWTSAARAPRKMNRPPPLQRCKPHALSLTWTNRSK
jgi:hypothetical protein